MKRKEYVREHWMHLDSPVGRICIEDDGEALTALFFDKGSEEIDDRPSELLQRTARELQEYFEGKRRAFDLPVHFYGTEFQEKVWGALQKIPYGETRSYAEIAREIGSPKACRAVGGANNRNRIMIIVPCHRVIGKDGSLVGFGGGLPVKEYLLNLES